SRQAISDPEPIGARYQGATVVRAGETVVVPCEPGFDREVTQPRPQQLRTCIVGLRDDLLTAHQIVHDQPDLTLTGDDGDVGNAKRSPLSVAAPAQRAVDEDIEGRGQSRLTGKPGQGHGDQSRPRQEIRAPLDPAKPARSAPKPARPGNRIAEPQAC